MESKGKEESLKIPERRNLRRVSERRCAEGEYERALRKMRLIGNSQKMRFRGYSVRNVMPLLICNFSYMCFSLLFSVVLLGFINFVYFLFEVIDYGFNIFYFIYICSIFNFSFFHWFWIKCALSSVKVQNSVVDLEIFLLY